MPRTLAFVPGSAPGAPAFIDLLDIPTDVREEVEETYVTIKANPQGRIRAEFANKTELAEYVLQVTSYCAQRPAGPIRFRKSPTKGLADNVMDFRITDLKTASEESTEAIREATAAANETPAPAKATKRTAAAK